MAADEAEVTITIKCESLKPFDQVSHTIAVPLHRLESDEPFQILISNLRTRVQEIIETLTKPK